MNTPEMKDEQIATEDSPDLTEDQVKHWVEEAQAAHQELSAELNGISRQ